MHLLIISPKEAYATKRLQEEAVRQGVAADFYDIHQLAAQGFIVDASRYSAIYIRQIYPYFSEMEVFAKNAAQKGIRIVDNNLATGSIDVSKWTLYQHLVRHNVSIPRTRLCGNVITESEHYPYVLKWIYGFGARHVYLIENKEAADRILNKYPHNELMMQEYIIARYEYKVVTTGFKCLPVIARHSIGTATRVADLSKGEPIPCADLPTVALLAESATNVLGRELASCDILEDSKGGLYIVDVNRSPGLEPFEQVTKYNAANSFIRHLIKQP